MQVSIEPLSPRTTTDLVFDQLHEEITSLKLLPHSRISEAEVANRMGVSRQPVRDAFNRLCNLGLLTIRPQRPTIVRGFSLETIQNSRFVRMAVEVAVITEACRVWDDEKSAATEKELEIQRRALRENEISRFHECDYHFHKRIFELSGHLMAFETVEQCKQQVDRLCVLSLGRQDEVAAVLADHERIAVALESKDPDAAVSALRDHLSRLDDTISNIHQKHSDYFE